MIKQNTCPKCGQATWQDCRDGDGFEGECFERCSHCGWEESFADPFSGQKDGTITITLANKYG